MESTLKNKLQNISIESLHTSVENNPQAQAIIQKTFLWMGIITFLTFASGYFVLYLLKSGTLPVEYNVLFWISMLGGLALVFIISFFWEKMNYATLAVLAILFALLEGTGLTAVLYMYSASSIINAFAGAGILFVVMALYGYFTKSDLTKLGVILLVGLIAVIVLSLVNMFLIKSGTFDLVLSVITLLIFLGLVAWNLQTLKLAALSGDKRLEIVFGISLFLDFINIFLTLLRLFGNSEEQ